MFGFCINMNMNTENCIKIIFLVLIALIGYIVLTIGFLAISLNKVFELYNAKFNHLKDLLLEIKGLRKGKGKRKKGREKGTKGKK